MKSKYLLNKPVGITPLEAIQYLKKTQPELENTPLGYAGRLDPMANGLLIILAGEENKKRKAYELLPKTYEFEILFGIETDTYDVLGLITQACQQTDVHLKQINTVLETYIGSFTQPYPPYSSARVQGKPLYYWARKGILNTLTIPAKAVQIQTAIVHSLENVRYEEIQQSILSKIQRLSTSSGDFRQNEILAQWKAFSGEAQYGIARCTVECSSGLYIRSLCHEIGHTLNTCALAYSITRTAVGDDLLNSPDVLTVPDSSLL